MSPRAALQISGPPCAGKSTYLRQLPASYWKLDDWLYHQSHGAATRDTVTATSWAQWWRYLDTALNRGPYPLAYITGKPTPRRPWVKVIVLNPGRERCHQRADMDNRPPITHNWIDDWYTRHGRTIGGE